MKTLVHTWLLFRRSVNETLRNPVWLVMGLFQPVCWLLLFGPLLDGVSHVPGFPPGGALAAFTPGVLVMMGMFGAAFVGFGLIADLRAGVVERLQVTPVSRLALLLGRALRDVLVLIVQSLILVAIAAARGLHVSGGALAATLALLALLGLVTASVSYGLALLLRSENALAPLLNFFTMPLLLLSGITLPLTLAPSWIRHAAALNPFAYAVDAARALFAGHGDGAVVVRGFVVVGILALVSMAWAARVFRRAAT